MSSTRPRPADRRRATPATGRSATRPGTPSTCSTPASAWPTPTAPTTATPPAHPAPPTPTGAPVTTPTAPPEVLGVQVTRPELPRPGYAPRGRLLAGALLLVSGLVVRAGNRRARKA